MYTVNHVDNVMGFIVSIYIHAGINSNNCQLLSKYIQFVASHQMTKVRNMISFLGFLVGPCCSSFYLFVLSYDVSLRSEFRVVMSVTISAYKRCSIRLHLQVFVGRLMYYLRYLCLFACSGVQQILCCVFVLFFFVLCTP